MSFNPLPTYVTREWGRARGINHASLSPTLMSVRGDLPTSETNVEPEVRGHRAELKKKSLRPGSSPSGSVGPPFSL